MRLVENSGTRPFVTDGMRGERNATWGEKGDHDETSAYLECVSVDCPSAETELVSYRQMNEPHLK